MCTLDSEELLLECSIGMKEATVKTTEVEAHMATYIIMVYCKLSQLQTMKDRLLGRLLTDGMDSG